MNIDASTISESVAPFIHPRLLAGGRWVSLPDGLGVSGFGDAQKFNLANHCLSFHAALYFLNRLRETRGVYTERTSYSWKHVTERWVHDQLGEHVSIPNGVLIAAAIYTDVKWRRVKDSPNCFFNLSIPRAALPPLADIEITLLAKAQAF